MAKDSVWTPDGCTVGLSHQGTADPLSPISKSGNPYFERMCQDNGFTTAHDRHVAQIAWEYALGGVLT